MFRGVNNLNLDAKGRMAVPAKYRDVLMASGDGRLVVTVDRDGCLLIYPLPEWERIEQALMARPNMDKQVRRLQRLLLGHATECDLDTQGRILLPTPLRDMRRPLSRANVSHAAFTATIVPFSSRTAMFASSASSVARRNRSESLRSMDPASGICGSSSPRDCNGRASASGSASGCGRLAREEPRPSGSGLVFP